MFVSPTVVGDTVVIGSCAGSLYALHRNTGEAIWLYPTAADGASAQFHGEPVLIGRTIVVPTDADPIGYLYSFDIESGDVQWKVAFPEGVATTPVLDRDRLVVVSALGTVASIKPSTGSVAWRVEPAGTRPSLPRLQSPATANGRIFFGDNAGKLFALDHADGKTIWKRDLTARLNTSLLVVGKTLLGGTIDGLLHHVAIDSGEKKHQTRLNGLPYGTLISAPPLVLILVKGDDARLIAYDAAKREIRWQQSTPREWTTYRPLVTGSTVIVGSEEKDLCAFALPDGARRWCINIGQVPRGLGVSRDGNLYVGTLSGKVLAYTPVAGSQGNSSPKP